MKFLRRKQTVLFTWIDASIHLFIAVKLTFIVFIVRCNFQHCLNFIDLWFFAQTISILENAADGLRMLEWNFRLAFPEFLIMKRVWIDSFDNSLESAIVFNFIVYSPNTSVRIFNTVTAHNFLFVFRLPMIKLNTICFIDVIAKRIVDLHSNEGDKWDA